MLNNCKFGRAIAVEFPPIPERKRLYTQICNITIKDNNGVVLFFIGKHNNYPDNYPNYKILEDLLAKQATSQKITFKVFLI